MRVNFQVLDRSRGITSGAIDIGRRVRITLPGHRSAAATEEGTTVARRAGETSAPQHFCCSPKRRETDTRSCRR